MSVRLRVSDILFRLFKTKASGSRLLGEYIIVSPSGGRMFLNEQLPDHRPCDL